LSRLDEIREKGIRTNGSRLDRIRENRTPINHTSKFEGLQNNPTSGDLINMPGQQPSTTLEQGGSSNWFVDSQKAIYDNTLKPVQDFANRTATGFLDGMGLGQPKKALQNNQIDNAPDFIKDMYKPAETTSEKVADVTGFLGGTLAPYSLAYKTAGKGLQLGYNALTKGIKPASKLGNLALKGGKLSAGGLGAGLGYGVTSEGADELINPEDKTFAERAKIVGLEGALGAVGDPVLRGVGVGLKKAYQSYGPGIKNKIDDLMSKFNKGEINEKQLEQEILLLPEGKTIKKTREFPKELQNSDKQVNFTMVDDVPLNFTGRLSPMNKTKIEKVDPLTPEDFNLSSKDMNIDFPFEGRFKKSSDNLISRKGDQTFAPAKEIQANDYTPDNVKEIVKSAVEKIDFSKLKDFSGFKYNSTDIYRNMRDVFKGNYPQVKKMIIDPFNKSKNDFTQMQKTLTKSLKENVVDRLGITKGSKLSKAVQDFGEKKLPLEDLKKIHPKDWEKVVEADKYFRQAYDNILHTINSTRAKIYPNNPEKQIPQRKDYYRHFREMNDLVGLKNIFDSPSAIDPSLVGISEFTKPSSKFQGFMQKRGLGKYKSDAVGGFLEYIPGASYATHIDPHINVFKKLGDEIAQRTESSKNLNNLINYLDKYSKDLAGKTNAADRWLQDNIPGGRKTMGVVRWVNNRVKKNTILGNAASALAQLGNVPNGIGATKQYAVKGAAQSMKDIVKRNEALVNQSPFLNERYVDRSFREFDTRWFEQPMRGAAWMIETADRIGTEFIWNSAYQQALAKKVANPIDYADDLARRMVAGRGVGEVPILQKSNVFQVLAPFQLEVANAWRVMGDFVKEKDATAIMTLFLASYMFNKGMEEIRGSGVVFDPIDAIIEASKPGLTPLERGGRIVGEIGSNIPFGQNLASAYPEYGTEAFGKKLPSREKLFGDEDPTRFGGGLIATKSLTDPFRYGALPFGGNQVSKTYRGAKSLLQGGLEKDNKLRFPVESTPSNIAKGLLFGPASTKEGKEYYEQNRKPLTEKQTETVKNSSDSKATYEDIQTRRRIDTINRKIKDVEKDKDLSEEKRDKKLKILHEKLKEIRGN
jgi:hypothetical protein